MVQVGAAEAGAAQVQEAAAEAGGVQPQQMTLRQIPQQLTTVHLPDAMAMVGAAPHQKQPPVLKLPKAHWPAL